MSLKKQDAGVWVKASEEQLPRVDENELLSIRWNGRPKVIKFSNNKWYWADDYIHDFPFVENDMRHIEWLKPVTGYLLTEDEMEKYITDFLEWIASNNYSRGTDRQKKYWFDKNGEGVGTTKEIYNQYIQSITNQ